MKIAYVLNSSDPYGGASKSFMTLLQGVVAQGHQAIVVLPDCGALKEKIDALGVNSVVLNYRPNTYPYETTIKDYFLWLPRLIARRYVNYRAYRKLTELICDVDIVHTNVSVIDIGARAAAYCGIPHVYHFREYGDLDFSYRYFPSKAVFLKSVTYSICITKGIQLYHKQFDSFGSIVIYNGINHRSDMIPVPDEKKFEYLLFAGRIEPAKGLDQLIEAYERSGIHTPLWIAGSAPKEMHSYINSLKSTIHKYCLDDRIVFLGSRRDVVSLMRNATAVVVPSVFEAFGRVMAEAEFQGCLVIGRDTGGTHEQFENGVKLCGREIGLRYKTVDELASRLKEVTTHCPEYYYEMKQNAFNVVNTLYSIEKSVESVLSFYENILNNQNKQ